MERAKPILSQDQVRRYGLLREFIKFPKYDTPFYHHFDFIALSKSQMKKDYRVICLLGDQGCGKS
jgi:hypothetical protein